MLKLNDEFTNEMQYEYRNQGNQLMLYDESPFLCCKFCKTTLPRHYLFRSLSEYVCVKCYNNLIIKIYVNIKNYLKYLYKLTKEYIKLIISTSKSFFNNRRIFINEIDFHLYK